MYACESLDSCCCYYFERNGLLALLEALCAKQISNRGKLEISRFSFFVICAPCSNKKRNSESVPGGRTTGIYLSWQQLQLELSVFVYS